MSLELPRTNHNAHVPPALWKQLRANAKAPPCNVVKLAVLELRSLMAALVRSAMPGSDAMRSVEVC